MWDYCRQADDQRWLRGLGLPLRYTATTHDYVGEVALVGAQEHRFRVQAQTNVHVLFVSAEGAEHELFMGNACTEFRVGRGDSASDRVNTTSPSARLAPNAAWSDVVVAWTPTTTTVAVNGQDPFTFARPANFDPTKAFHSTGFGHDGCWEIPAQTYPHFRYFLANPTSTHQWHSYYQYYYNRRDTLFADTIIVKCDDNVVAIDTQHFGDFIQFRRQNPQHLLVFPNIVNNGVAAYYQQQNGAIPTELMQLELPPTCGSLWESAAKCAALHAHFLSDPSRFAYAGSHVLPPHLRFSINFFAILPKDLVFFADAHVDDERDLSVNLCVQHGRTKCVFNGCYVSHLSFYSQEAGMNTGDLIAAYTALLASTAPKLAPNTA